MERKFKKVEEKEEIYLGNYIYACRVTWEEYNENKDKWENKSKIYCCLDRVGYEYQPLDLGECNDGSKFTSINQAINEAKDFINFTNGNYTKRRRFNIE